jgi:tetratricopeptide (TPR) repeat protein
MYTSGYYPHNYDFLAFAASLIGRSAQAMGATEKTAALIDDASLGTPGMTFLQHLDTRHLQMKVRFAKWDDILKAQLPPPDVPHARGMSLYARGRALVATGDPAGAQAALKELRSIAADPQVAPLRMEFNTSGAVLSIAAEALAGHIAAAARDYARASTHFAEAARFEDALTYGEPPEWSVPVRQEWGRVLLQAGQPAEAERVFREDLQRFPRNGWSLRGLEQALRVAGRSADADAAAAQFREVWATADVPPPGTP